MKKNIVLLLVSLLLLVFGGCRDTAAGHGAAEKLTGDLSILFTNDIHCSMDGSMGYEAVAVAKDAIEKSGGQVILVDSGDCIQGDILGSYTQGASIVEIMNSLGYDAMALGNHEFDYGIPRLLELEEQADFDLVCCNFVDLDGNALFAPYTIIEKAGVKVAFIGITTPLTMQASVPSEFQDEDGSYIYDFFGDKTGDRLAERVSATAAEARSEGADYVIALSHIGIGADLSPFASTEMIPKISGVDVYLDAHSHSVVECDRLRDKDGKEVVLSQTGTGLEYIGILSFHQDGTIESKLIDNKAVRNTVSEKSDEINEITQQFVGVADVDLRIYDPANTEQRIIRLAETNLGDLVADSFRAYGNSDIGLNNSGGIRANIDRGDISYGNIFSVVPFLSRILVIKASGQQILDALEYGTSKYPKEFGGFLQVSGLSFTLDPSVPSPVILDDNGAMVSIEGSRRVSDVCVGEEPLDPEKTYTVASTDYIFREYGDGNTAFADSEIILDEEYLDYQVIIDYIKNDLGGIVGEKYGNPYGEGRIKIK